MENQEPILPRQRATVEFGLSIVVAALGLGIGSGRWPEWTLMVGAAGYAIWVLAYAEITVQVDLRRRAGPRQAIAD